MSTLSQFAGGIKSIQRGVMTVTPSAGLGTATATITAVNTSKSVVTLLGTRFTANDYGNINCRIELTNSTTVTAQVNAAGAAMEIGWQVVEFY